MRRSAIEVALLTVMILVCSTTLHGLEGSWEPAGLEGASIWALEISPSGVILAGTAWPPPNTVSRSVDYGATWTDAVGLPGSDIWALEFDPSDESVVYAGLNGPGVWKSLDGGQTWSWANLDGQVWEVAVSPTDPDILYVASQTGGVYKSLDAGSTWSQLDLGEADNATAVVVHPMNHDIALVGTPFWGIFKTEDGGATWWEVNTGLGSTQDIRSLLFDPQNPMTVYAGEMGNGVFKSLDGGITWFKPDPALSGTIESIEVLGGDLYINDVFDGSGKPAYRSQDEGISWEPLEMQDGLSGSLWPRALAVIPGAVLLGTEPFPNLGGIYIWELPVTVDTVSTWIDDAVFAGSLTGTGNVASSDRRLNALINMVELTAELVDAGLIDEACAELLSVFRKTDGQSPPPDFVEGPAAEDLGMYIQALRGSLGCG